MLFIAGLALAALLVWRFVAALEPAERFLAPGNAQVDLAHPGEYVIWHEHRAIHQGRSYDVPAGLPDGTRFTVQAPDGSAVPVQAFSGMRSEGSEGESVSVARFEVPAAGAYRVAVEGRFDARPMSVGPNRLWPMLKLAGTVLAVLALAMGGALAAGLYGFSASMPSAPVPASGPLPVEREKSLRQIATMVYGLQAAALVVGLTFFVAVILGYLRRRDAAGTWLESHFTWQIRTFWWSLAWSILGLATLVLVVGFFILLASAVWYVYRIVRGWTQLNEGRPLYGR
ncbi:MAG TPA: hypothetical protein VFZ84_20355 [Burkholderiales bacterium]